MSPNFRRVHYGWVVAAVTFVILLVGAGVRATPGVLMVPLETEFGWNRTAISFAVAINIALFGLIGPFAAAVMNRFGVRRVLLGALALMTAAVAATTLMRAEWHLVLLWGVLVGGGTGATSMILAAIIATRWFDQHRGLVLGVLDVQQNKVGGLTAEDAELIQSIANQAAIALQNAHSYRRAQRQADLETLVNTIGQKIQNTTSIEGALQVAVREVGRAVGAQQTRVRLKAAQADLPRPGNN